MWLVCICVDWSDKSATMGRSQMGRTNFRPTYPLSTYPSFRPGGSGRGNIHVAVCEGALPQATEGRKLVLMRSPEGNWAGDGKREVAPAVFVPRLMESIG